jgi:hypothetical protein
MSQPKVGDFVYWPRYGTLKVEKQCPVCFGNCKVTLILGNGDDVILPCDYCGKGYEGPRGYVSEYEYTVGYDCGTITEIRGVETAAGRTLEYVAGHSFLKYDAIFSSKEAAEDASKALAEKARQEDRKRAAWLKERISKTYAWNAGYHMRCVKKAQKEIEYHSEKAVLCKAKAKTERRDA